MQNEKKHSILSRIFLLVGVVALIFIAVAIYREAYKKRQIQQQIGELQKEAERISRENSFTQEKIAYLESQDYKEKEAKDKLNLQNPDENVVIVEQGVVNKESQAEKNDSQVPAPVVQQIYNPLKWWDYFFKY
jgi:cell division protein FtsB